MCVCVVCGVVGFQGRNGEVDDVAKGTASSLECMGSQECDGDERVFGDV